MTTPVESSSHPMTSHDMTPLKTLSTQSPDVVNIIEDYGFYVGFRGIEIKKMELPVGLNWITQCCVHKNKIFIGTSKENLGNIGDLFLWSPDDKNSYRNIFKTNRRMLEFVIFGDKLIVLVSPYFTEDILDNDVTCDVTLFTLDGDFHSGFNFYEDDDFIQGSPYCAIDDVQVFIYVFCRHQTKTYSLDGKHIRNENFSAEEYFCKNRDKNGNVHFMWSSFEELWVRHAISESKQHHLNSVRYTGYGYAIDGNYKLHENDVGYTNVIRYGHVSKLNTLFLCDSLQILVVDSGNPGVIEAERRNVCSSLAHYSKKIQHACSKILTNVMSDVLVLIGWAVQPNRPRSSIAQIPERSSMMRLIQIQKQEQDEDEDQDQGIANGIDRIRWSTLDANGKLYVFTSTHCHIYA